MNNVDQLGYTLMGRGSGEKSDDEREMKNLVIKKGEIGRKYGKGGTEEEMRRASEENG